jgi:hypothetical protein
MLLESASAQTKAVDWAPLSQQSPSPFYAERPITPLSHRLHGEQPSDTVPPQIKPTHWKEGGIAGAVLLGAFSIWFFNELCQNTDAGADSGCSAKAVLGGVVAGGGVGFLIGALIGGQFPKHPQTTPAATP